MSFSKNDIDSIKSKIVLSSEIEKKTKLIKKGKDYWGCCIFHKEKTPSLKVNDEQGSYYCFGCGAKGDIFNLYTDLYNYNFQDAVKELAQKVGVKIRIESNEKIKENDVIREILEASCEWFCNNLLDKNDNNCNEYLKKRKISKQTIEVFKLGFSFNSNTTLYSHLKKKSFKHEDILKSNVVKIDNNNNVRDFFYKRLIFPIYNEYNKIVGFGGRSLNDSLPKYLNSPESYFFHKRELLYNLPNAKSSARKKNNLLISEGYMDVISLFQNGIKSVVAPLGTALTEDQIKLAWKFSSKPTIMFDGDKAGLRASFKAAIMSLDLISPNKFLQFINLPDGYDPDSYINNFSFEELLKILKKPEMLVNFIFNQSSKAIRLDNADEKISFDKYLEDLTDKIKDNKIKFFYKNEFKSLFFKKIKNQKKIKNNELENPKNIKVSLFNKQILSFIAAAINHVSSREEIIKALLETDLFDENYKALLDKILQKQLLKIGPQEIKQSTKLAEYQNIINECLNSSIYELFPYSSPLYESNKSLEELKESSQNLNTRLLKLKKINKSLDNFVSNSNQLHWDELQNINIEILGNTD